MGDIKVGFIMGVILEFVFIGLFLIGGFILFDVVIGGIFGVVFLIVLKIGIEIVFFLVLLIVIFILILKNVYLGFLIFMLLYKVDIYVEEGNIKGIERM